MDAVRRLALSDLHPGQTLSKPVYGASGALLLTSGRTVTEQFLESLDRWGIRTVYVDEGVVPATVVPEAVRSTYYEAIGQIRVSMQQLRRGEAVDLGELGGQLASHILRLVAEPGILSCLHLLRERDDYTSHHCIDVGIVASLLGEWLGLNGEDLRQVAMSGTMHDLGKAWLPLELLNKPGRLTPEEFAIVQQHTTIGYDVLSSELGGDSVAARVALEHHERTDGGGYPRRLKADQTLLVSRIVAVADVYDAMTSQRVYHDRSPEFAVLAKLRGDAFGLLDPRVVGVFLDHTIHHAHGRRVRLNNGLIGRVVFVRPGDPTRPVVEIGPDLIDLRDRGDLSMVDEVDER